MFSNHVLYYKFFIECASEKILRIGQYLTKIWTKLHDFLKFPKISHCGLLFCATL